MNSVGDNESACTSCQLITQCRVSPSKVFEDCDKVESAEITVHIEMIRRQELRGWERRVYIMEKQRSGC